MIRQYTFTIFSENNPGLLNRITSVFNRRKMNIDSITTAKSEIPDVHRYNIVAQTNQLEANKINLQIEKQIEVIKSLVSTDAEIIHREVALYKLKNSPELKSSIGNAISYSSAVITREEEEYIVVQHTGREEENEKLLEVLSPFGVYEFSRSGRICVMKAMDHISEYIHEL